MKTFSLALATALARTDLTPVWLLTLELTGPAGDRTIRLADRPFSLGGLTWSPTVIAWGGIDRYFDPDTEELSISDVTIHCDNRPGAVGSGDPNLSWFMRAYDLSASTATLSLWLDGAGLAYPGDLLTVLTGRPELAGEVTPLVCPLDIVAQSGPAGGRGNNWGPLLTGRYSREQWPALPSKVIGDPKPMVFGAAPAVEGVPLLEPVRAGKVEGPATLFDPTSGASTIEIRFPDQGAYHSDNPYPAPCALYVGDWRLSIRRPPEKGATGAWVYTPESRASLSRRLYIPHPLVGSTPLFTPSPDAWWPRSSPATGGPFASAEPTRGMPFQFHHGLGDIGSSADGGGGGRHNVSITNIAVEENPVDSADVTIDDAYGIVWLKTDENQTTGKIANPTTTFLRYTGVDHTLTTGATWLRPEQLTARYPRGYHVAGNPCLLGDFTVPASGGGAPASSHLALTLLPAYPRLGARTGSVRFVFRYTGLEVTNGGTIHFRLFGVDHAIAMEQLATGTALPTGWSLALLAKGVSFEVWPDNLGYFRTLASPQPRVWDVYELSLDVTTEALAHLNVEGGWADTMEVWVSGTVWPDLNSLIVMETGIEVTADAAVSAVVPPRVTAKVTSPHTTAGEIVASLLPSGMVGAGFDDPSLPALSYRVDRQIDAAHFARKVLREADVELVADTATGVWNLVRRSTLRDPASPPTAPTSGIGVIDETDLLADADGLPMIVRVRTLPDALVNEVILTYRRSDGALRSVTTRNEGSVVAYGLRTATRAIGARMSDAEAKALADATLKERCEPRDYYRLTFPLGEGLAFEPGDIIAVTATMDLLSGTVMRVVSAEIDPGSLTDGRLATVTLNAERYARVRKGFGQTAFGLTPFGLSEILEN